MYAFPWALHTIRVSASNCLLDILRILSLKQSKKGCSHGAIANVTAIYLTQLMGCVGFGRNSTT